MEDTSSYFLRSHYSGLKHHISIAEYKQDTDSQTPSLQYEWWESCDLPPLKSQKLIHQHIWNGNFL